MYGKLVNGVLEYAPVNYKLENGYILYNFNSNVSLMLYYGFKPVVDNKPSYDTQNEKIKIKEYEELNGTIIIHYEVSKIISKEQMEEKIIKLENQNNELETRLEITQQALDDLLMNLMNV